ncbi:MAG: peptide deformylase, partial [Deltaproteobacteria bacterium]
MTDERTENMKIHVYPDPVLRARAEKVLDIDEETQTLIDGMITTMYAAPGIVIAAKQVGNLARIIVFDLHTVE